MGLGNREKKTYLRLSKGKFRKIVPEGTPNAVKVAVTDDNGNIVKYNYELQWDNISGKVLSAKIMANQSNDKYPDNFCILLMDEYGEKYIIQVSTESGLYTKLLNKLCNPSINWNETLHFEAFYFESENKSAVVISQKDTKIEPLFTKEKPGDLPPFPVNAIDSNGKVINKDLMKIYQINTKLFLSNYFFANVKIDPFSDLEEKHHEEPVSAPVTNDDSTVPPNTEDDLPF